MGKISFGEDASVLIFLYLMTGVVEINRHVDVKLKNPIDLSSS